MIRRTLYPDDALFSNDRIALHQESYNSPNPLHPFVPSTRKPYHGTDLCLAFRTAPSSSSSPCFSSARRSCPNSPANSENSWANFVAPPTSSACKWRTNSASPIRKSSARRSLLWRQPLPSPPPSRLGKTPPRPPYSRQTHHQSRTSPPNESPSSLKSWWK